jgi:hypothetical protein
VGRSPVNKIQKKKKKKLGEKKKIFLCTTITLRGSNICEQTSNTDSLLNPFEEGEVSGAMLGMKKWVRGKGIKFTANFLRSELS